MNRREALAALVAMPEIARISVAAVRPRDVIVVECKDRLSMETRSVIREQLQMIWPGQKIVVLDKDMTLKVVEGTPTGT